MLDSIAKNPHLPRSMVSAIAEHGDERALRAVASYQDLDDALIDTLCARARSGSTLHQVMLRLDRRDKRFASLADHENFAVRMHVAECTDSTQVLDTLSKDLNNHVRYMVAAYAWNLPTYVQRRLLMDVDHQVRALVAEVASNKDIIRLAARDRHPAVRLRTANNRQAPDDVLQSLRTDKNIDVARVATRRMAHG